MKAIKSIVSLALALMLLVSATSFSVDMHFCGDHLQSFSLLTEADPCPMEVNLPPCHQKMAKPNSCCNDSQVIHQANDPGYPSISITLSSFDIDYQVQLPLIMEVIQNETIVDSPNYYSYKPPLTDRDIPVFIQSFLI